MKRFLIKITSFIGSLILIYFVFLYILSNQYVDGYYYKFTGYGNSLIIGLSRAHDGIVPSVLAKELGEKVIYDAPLVNYAFEKAQSPFGDIYLNAIRGKINPSTTNGLFVISITPGSFLASEAMSDDYLISKDKKMMIGKINDFTSQPNYDYLMNCYAQSLYNVLFLEKNKDLNRIVHKDGWNEFKLSSKTYDVTSTDLLKWKNETIMGYTQITEKEKISNYRIQSFVKTIRYLKDKGNVFIVRMPVSSEVWSIENNYWGNFDHQFDSISKLYKIPYFNYSQNANAYQTYDGSHLVSESAIEFTKILAIDIENELSSQANCQ